MSIMSVMSRRKRKPWSDDEIATLRAYYTDNPGKTFSVYAIAEKLDRHVSVVSLRASQLGLTKRGRPRSAELVEKIRQTNIGRKPTARCLAAVSVAAKKMWATDKAFSIGRMSEAARQRRSDQLITRRATNPNMRRGYSRGKMGRRADLGNQHFRSSWEANYARYLNWLQVKGDILRWEFEPDTFWFEKIKRGVRSYLPDFKVWPVDGGSPYYVEVKGYMDAKSVTKLKRMKKYYPMVKIELFDATRYKVLDRRMKNTLPGWEGGSVPVSRHDEEDTGALVCE